MIRAAIILMNDIGMCIIQGRVFAVSVANWLCPCTERVLEAAVGLEEEVLGCTCPQFASCVAGFQLARPLVLGNWILWVSPRRIDAFVNRVKPVAAPIPSYSISTLSYFFGF